MCKDKENIADGKRKTVCLENKFLLDTRNFNSLPYYGPVNYRKELYKLLADCGFYHTNVTWKNRFLYPEKFLPLYENEKLIFAMENCLRVIMQKYFQDIENLKQSQKKKEVMQREYYERKQIELGELLEN